MYAGVPRRPRAELGVLTDARGTRAMPKSSTFTSPSSRMITFSGFTSRWTTPARCAAASAPPISTSHRTRVRAGTDASPTRRRSDVPGTSSMTMNEASPERSASKTLVAFGWRIAAAARASRSADATASSAPSPSTGGASTLIATARRSRASNARYTVPIVPSPRRLSIV